MEECVLRLKLQQSLYDFMFSERIVDFFSRIWIFILSILGEDFVFLALLGFFMACIVHLINRGVAICNSARMWLWGQIAINQHYASQYFAWSALPIVLILFSTAFTDIVSPAAKGSGTTTSSNSDQNFLVYLVKAFLLKRLTIKFLAITNLTYRDFVKISLILA